MNRAREKANQDVARAMRERGYNDGRAGKPAAYANADYQRSWRRGREQRNEQ